MIATIPGDIEPLDYSFRSRVLGTFKTFLCKGGGSERGECLIVFFWRRWVEIMYLFKAILWHGSQIPHSYFIFARHVFSKSFVLDLRCKHILRIFRTGILYPDPKIFNQLSSIDYSLIITYDQRHTHLNTVYRHTQLKHRHTHLNRVYRHTQLKHRHTHLNTIHRHTQLKHRHTHLDTGIGRKNETDYNICNSLTSYWGHLRSGFYCIPKLFTIINSLGIQWKLDSVPNYL